MSPDKSKIARDLLIQALNNASVKDLSVDPESVDYTKLNEIVSAQCYDPMVSAEILWAELFEASFCTFAPQDHPAGTRLSQTEKDSLIQIVHGKLSRVPIPYEILLPLPAAYPFADKSFLDNVRIGRISAADRKIYLANRRPRGVIDQTPSKEDPLIPELETTYIFIKDSGLVRPGGEVVLESRHDPVRIYRLYIALHAVTGNLIVLPWLGLQRFIVRAYEDKRFVANIAAPVNSNGPLAIARFRDEDSEQVERADAMFCKLLAERDDTFEGERIRVSNSLHWYFEYANTDDINLRAVYLVSAFDSLFGFVEKNYIPTVRDIAPVIAEVNARSFRQRTLALEAIQRLYNLRNEVIHGRKEIQKFRRIDAREKRHIASTIEATEHQYKQYIAKQLELYSNS